MTKHAVNLTELDKFWLDKIKRYGFITVDGSGLDSAGVEGASQPPPWRVKRLIDLGKLQPRNDGLLDGCSQTYGCVPDDTTAH